MNADGPRLRAAQQLREANAALNALPNLPYVPAAVWVEDGICWPGCEERVSVKADLTEAKADIRDHLNKRRMGIHD